MSDTMIADAAALLQANYVGFVVNTESLRQIRGHFNPSQFDPIKVAHVGENMRIVDGFTRTMWASEHPEFTLPAIDVTAGLLRNPVIADPDAAERDSLNPAEYLRALIPPTVVHAAIAEKRIAAYIAVAWQDLIGAERAEHFSALAAVWRLEKHHGPFPQAPYYAGETAEDHVIITAALNVIQAVMTKEGVAPFPGVPPAHSSVQSKYAWDIAAHLFKLILTQDPAIGGQDGTVREIWGLLHDPVIDAKCRQAEPLTPETARERLAVFLLGLLKKKPTHVGMAHRFLLQPELPLTTVYRFFDSGQPYKAYELWVDARQSRPPAPPPTAPSMAPPTPATPSTPRPAETPQETIRRGIETEGPVSAEQMAQLARNQVRAMAVNAIRSACNVIVAQVAALAGAGPVDPLDADTTHLIDEAVKALGQLRYNVADLPGLVLIDHPQLSARYTRLLEQHIARGGTTRND